MVSGRKRGPVLKYLPLGEYQISQTPDDCDRVETVANECVFATNVCVLNSCCSWMPLYLVVCRDS